MGQVVSLRQTLSRISIQERSRKDYNEFMHMIIPILALMIPLAIIMGSAIKTLIPVAYVVAGVYGIKFLMDVRHKQKMELLEKQKEIEMLALDHLKEADKLLENPGKD